MNEALKYIDDIVPYIIASLLPYTVLRTLFYSLYTKKRFRTSALHEASLALLSASLVAAAALTVLPEFLQFTVSKPETLTYNLKPFMIFVNSRNHIVQSGNYSYFFLNFFGNLVLLLPASFFFCLSFRRVNLIKAAAAGASVSLIIEILQYSLGRCADIDDLMLNTAGALTGFALCKLVSRAFPGFSLGCKARETVKPKQDEAS